MEKFSKLTNQLEFFLAIRSKAFNQAFHIYKLIQEIVDEGSRDTGRADFPRY